MPFGLDKNRVEEGAKSGDQIDRRDFIKILAGFLIAEVSGIGQKIMSLLGTGSVQAAEKTKEERLNEQERDTEKLIKQIREDWPKFKKELQNLLTKAPESDAKKLIGLVVSVVEENLGKNDHINHARNNKEQYRLIEKQPEQPFFSLLAVDEKELPPDTGALFTSVYNNSVTRIPKNLDTGSFTFWATFLHEKMHFLFDHALRRKLGEGYVKEYMGHFIKAGEKNIKIVDGTSELLARLVEMYLYARKVAPAGPLNDTDERMVVLQLGMMGSKNAHQRFKTLQFLVNKFIASGGDQFQFKNDFIPSVLGMNLPGNGGKVLAFHPDAASNFLLVNSPYAEVTQLHPAVKIIEETLSKNTDSLAQK